MKQLFATLFFVIWSLSKLWAIDNNIILYTTINGRIINLTKGSFGANIVSNTYKNGQGIITFDSDVSNIGEGAFYGCYKLTSITIPNSVTSIGNEAFYCCYNLANITIPNSVTSIGEYAFTGCNGLTSITIPNSVTSIGNDAFYNCSSLTDITIPNSVTSIGEYAFSCCNGLTSITIPNSVTSIGNYAFYGCYNLANITIPNSVTSIGKYAFSGCSELTVLEGIRYADSFLIEVVDKKRENYVIKEGTRVISNGAFNGCSGLTSITIPNSVTSIGNDAFSLCSGLTSMIVEKGNPVYDSRNNCNAIIETASNTLVIGCQNTIIPNSVTSISDSAFYGCSGLTSITIPNSVTSIGNDAFSLCSGLTSMIVEKGNPVYDSRNNCNAIIKTASNTLVIGCQNTIIPNSVTSIGNRAFYYCHGLTSITIPNSVTSISDSAFYRCSGLTSITIPNSVTSIGNDAFDGCWGLTSMIVGNGNPVYDSRNNCNAIIETASNTLVIGCQNTIIPNSVTSIGNEAFKGCSGLTNITIPNSVTSIGKEAFSWCDNLTSITIPNSVTSIGNYAFYYCYNLANITIPNSVTSIGNMAFYYCHGLTSITIPNSVTSIGNEAFAGCWGLTSITIPNSVTSIGIGAFAGCGGLTSITIPNSVTSIGNYAFNGCSGLTSITIPNSVTSIGNYAFSGCSGLTSITIPNSVTSIGNGAFFGCSGLTSITIPNSVTSIGNEAFYYCYNLANITIPNSVTSIGNEAFYNCSSLTDITVLAINPPSVIEYSDHIINNVTLHVLPGCKKTYESADYWYNFTNIIEDAVNPDASVMIADGTIYDYNYDRIISTLTYTRTFSSPDKWQAFYVPFSIPVDVLTEKGLEVVELNNIHMYDTDGDKRFDKTTLEFLYLTDGETEANYPYLIKSANAGEVKLTLQAVELKAAAETQIECATTRKVFKIRGTYTGVSGEDMFNNNYYAVGGGTLIRAASADNTLKPQRWYMNIENKDGSPIDYYAPKMRIMINGVEIDEEGTGIQDITTPTADNIVCTLDGRKMNTSALPSGIYVKNRQKMIIR